MVKKESLGEWTILDNWSVLIKDAHGRGEKVLKETEKVIKESKAPDIRMEKVKVGTGGLSGLLSKTKERDYLRVANEDLEHYRMYIGARDYGNNLDVQWYLVRTIRRLKRRKISESLKAVAKDARRGIVGINLFEEQDLRAYVTLIHHSLLEAVENLMASLNQDPSKIERKSRGFLGVS